MKKLLQFALCNVITLGIYANINPLEELTSFIECSETPINAYDIEAYFAMPSETCLRATFGQEETLLPSVTVARDVAAISATKFVAVFQDRDDGFKGKAIIGEVNGTNITFGSLSLFDNSSIANISVISPDPSHFVVAYNNDIGNNPNISIGAAKVGIIDGLEISGYGSPATFNESAITYNTVVKMSSTNFVIAYVPFENNSNTTRKGSAIVGQINDTELSFGPAWVYNPKHTQYSNATKIGNNRFVVTYGDFGDNEYGKAIIGEVDGTTITYGNPKIFDLSPPQAPRPVALDDSRFVTAYRDLGNGNQGTAIVGQTDGVEIIAFGPKSIYNAAPTQSMSPVALSDVHFAVSYRDEGNNNLGTTIIGVVNDLTICSYSAELPFRNGAVSQMDVAYLGDNKFINVYVAGAGENDNQGGRATVGLVDTLGCNLQTACDIPDLADVPNWAFSVGGITNSDRGFDIATDADGNVYVVGRFGDIVDFDHGPNTAYLSSNGAPDAFVAKYDQYGNYLWAFNIGGTVTDDCLGIALDAVGNVYVTGGFGGTADFNPSGSSTNNLTSNVIGDNAFVAKYSSDGEYQWAFTFNIGSTQNLSNHFGRDIAVDAAGNVYITGSFHQTADFNPDNTITNNLSSNGGVDAFVAKYNSEGEYQWAFNIGSPRDDRGIAIAVDPVSNDILVTGFFNSTADFNPAPGTTNNLTSAGSLDVFVAKYDQNANYQWAIQLGGNDDDRPFGIAVNASSNVYSTGFFRGTADFNSDPANTNNLTSSGGQDYYLAKFNSDGEYQWATNAGGMGDDVGTSVDLDDLGNVYVSGSFLGTEIDFNPDSNLDDPLNSNGGTDVFVAKYRPDGLFEGVFSMGGPNYDYAWGINIGNNRKIHTTGTFSGLDVNFDPGNGFSTMLSSSANGDDDIFVAAYESTVFCPTNITNQQATICDCSDLSINDEGCPACNNDGLSFADVVISSNLTCPGINPNTNPQDAIGPPNIGIVDDEVVGIAGLGEGGTLSLGFTNNLLTNSGDSYPDLRVFEDAKNETFLVELRPFDQQTRDALVLAGIPDNDRDGYYDFGSIFGGAPNLDLDAFLPGHSPMTLLFDAVQMTDDADGVCAGNSPGADIDAICALSSFPSSQENTATTCSDGIDNDGDGLIDCADEDCSDLAINDEGCQSHAIMMDYLLLML